MADIKSTIKGLEKIAEVLWRRYETASGDKMEEYRDAHDAVTDAINLLKEMEQSLVTRKGKMESERDLEELVKEAIENCMANKCSECPFKGLPAHCVAILMHKLRR